MKSFSCSAILFDLDGVLVDSTRQVDREWREWATRKGVDGDAVMAIAHGGGRERDRGVRRRRVRGLRRAVTRGRGRARAGPRAHDDRGAGDDLGRRADALDHGPTGVAVLQVLLPHPAHQEHLVVHREAEQDREHQHRRQGHGN